MKRFLCIFFLLTCFLRVSAGELIDKDWKDCRIRKLLPGLYTMLAVDPNLPVNYIAMARPGEELSLESNDLYWGPKDVLEKAFEGSGWKKLTRPIIRISKAPYLKQKGEKGFDGDLQRYTQFYSQGIQIVSEDTKRWGDYPVRFFHTKTSEGKFQYTAWVGLNTESKDCLLVQLIYPNKTHHPSHKDISFWKDFIHFTTPLRDDKILQALGHDIMDEGETLFNLDGSIMEIVAERRTSDNQLQVTLVPRDPKLKFVCEEFKEGYLKPSADRADLAVLKGLAIKFAGKNDVILKTEIITKIKEVDEFSWSEEEIRGISGSEIFIR